MACAAISKRWRRRWLLVPALWIIVTTVGLASAHAETIRLATLEWPPYIGRYLTDNGYVASLIREAYRLEGYAVHFDFFPWARVVHVAKSDQYDGYFPEYYAAEIAEMFYFSKSFPGGPIGFFKRRDRKLQFSSLNALNGMTIGVVRGYVNTKEFDHADNFYRSPANNDLQNLKKLLNQRIDLAVADKYVGNYLLDMFLPKQKDDIEFMDPPLEKKELYLCIGKQGTDAQKKLAAFNRGLEKLRSSGRLLEILHAHGIDPEREE